MPSKKKGSNVTQPNDPDVITPAPKTAGRSDDAPPVKNVSASKPVHPCVVDEHGPELMEIPPSGRTITNLSRAVRRIE